jgi:hypothetical protein
MSGETFHLSLGEINRDETELCREILLYIFQSSGREKARKLVFAITVEGGPRK